MTLDELIERADENHFSFVRGRESHRRLPDPAMSTHVQETMLHEGPKDADWSKDLIRLLPSSSKEKITTFKRFECLTEMSKVDWPSGMPSWSTG